MLILRSAGRQVKAISYFNYSALESRSTVWSICNDSMELSWCLFELWDMWKLGPKSLSQFYFISFIRDVWHQNTLLLLILISACRQGKAIRHSNSVLELRSTVKIIINHSMESSHCFFKTLISLRYIKNGTRESVPILYHIFINK